MPQSTARSFLGIAKEATFGTPVASTAFIPVTAVTPKDALTLFQDKGLRGSMVDEYGEVSGPLHGELDFNGDVFPDTVGFPIVGVLGDVTTTGASAPYTHAVASLNTGTGQPPSYTLNDSYVAGNRQYAGAKFSEFTFTFNADGLLTYAAKATTLGSVTAATPTPSFTNLGPIASWTGLVQINGSPALEVLDGEVSIKRPVTVITPVNGSQAPSSLWSGPIAVTGKATIVMEDDTFLTQYLTNAQPSVDLNFQQGSGATLTQVKLHMSKVAITAADITRGKDYIEIPITWNAFGNTTDVGASAGYSPIKVTLQNAMPSGTYK